MKKITILLLLMFFVLSVVGQTLIILPQNSTICAGTIDTLHVKGGGSDFTWSPSLSLSASTGDTVIAIPTVTTTYTVTGLDSTGKNATGYDTVVVNPLPHIILYASSSICGGDTLIANGCTTYIWMPSTGLSATIGSSVFATPSVTTTYTVTGTDSLHCTAIDSIVVFAVPSLNRPVIDRQGNVLISAATVGNQWVRNDTVIAGATNQTYTVSTIGCYWVIATNPANNCTIESDTLCVDSITGINHLSINTDHISIYPNPTVGEISINIKSSEADVKDWNLQITDLLGRTVYNKLSLNYSNDIDLSNLPCGVYFMTVINKVDSAAFTLVKQN